MGEVATLRAQLSETKDREKLAKQRAAYWRERALAAEDKLKGEQPCLK